MDSYIEIRSLTDCPWAVKPLNKQTLAKYNSLLYDVPLSPNRSVLISTCAHLYLGGLGGLGTFVSWFFLDPAWPTRPSCRASMSGTRKHCLFSFHKNWAKAFSISSGSFRNSSKTCFFFMQSGKVAHHPLDLISLSADGILQWPLIVKSLCSNRAIGISNNTKSTCQKWVLYCTLSYAIIIYDTAQWSDLFRRYLWFVFHSVSSRYLCCNSLHLRISCWTISWLRWLCFWHCFPCRQDSTNPARISLQCRRPRGFLLVAVNIAGSHIYIYITYKNFQRPKLFWWCPQEQSEASIMF